MRIVTKGFAGAAIATNDLTVLLRIANILVSTVSAEGDFPHLAVNPYPIIIHFQQSLSEGHLFKFYIIGTWPQNQTTRCYQHIRYPEGGTEPIGQFSCEVPQEFRVRDYVLLLASIVQGFLVANPAVDRVEIIDSASLPILKIVSKPAARSASL